MHKKLETKMNINSINDRSCLNKYFFNPNIDKKIFQNFYYYLIGM